MEQLQTLNKILKSKDPSFIFNNNLDVSYFPDYEQEYTFIIDHVNKHGTVPDIESFLNLFDDFNVLDVSESDDYLLSKLQEDKKRRYLATTINNIRQFLIKDDVEAAFLELHNQANSNIGAEGLKCIDITKDTSRYNDYVERLNSFDKFYVSTGFKELDDIIGGWDREEELATIVARTNVGKTWALLKSAFAAVEQGLNVGLYSGEMSAKKVGYRFDTLAGHISNGSLTHGNESIKNEYKRYIDSLPTRYSGSLKVLTPQMIDGPAGVNSLRSFIRKEKLDILFIDQHSLLEDDRKAKTPVERAANISRDLKNLQVMEKIPIISVSQQNRTKTEDNLVDTTQIAQSDRIGQDSTVIIFLEKKDNVLTMSLVKSRDSENGKKLVYKVDFNTGLFEYCPDADNKDNNEEIKKVQELKNDFVHQEESKTTSKYSQGELIFG